MKAKGKPRLMLTSLLSLLLIISLLTPMLPPPIKSLDYSELSNLVAFLIHVSLDSRIYYVVTLAFHALPGQAEGALKNILVPFWVNWSGLVDGRSVSVKGYVISVTFEAYMEDGKWRLYRWYPNPSVAIPLPGPVKDPSLVDDAIKAERIAREWLKSKGVQGAIVKFANIVDYCGSKVANVVAVDCRSSDDWTLWRIVVDLDNERVVEDKSRPGFYWGPPWRCTRQ